MRYQGRFEENKQNNGKKKAGRIILAVILIFALLAGGAAVWGIRYYHEMFDKMQIVTLDKNLYETYSEATTEASLPQETQEPGMTTETVEEVATEETTRPPFTSDDIVNILVVGQASRAGEEGHMADSTILVTVNTYDGTVKLSSVLRDTLVDLPSYKSHGAGRNKFNMAYQLGYTYDGIEGAMAYTNLTMYHNFGVEVDYNVEISFESFTKLIDYMGGIEIELTEAEANYLNDDDLYVKYEVQPGLQYLDGMAALSYARMRKAEGDADSDIKRTDRQQKVIEILFEKVRNLGLKELQGVVDTLLPLVTTTMTPKDVADLMIKMLPHLNDLKFEKGSIPIQTTYWGVLQEPYGSVLLFYPDQNKRLIREFTEGEPNPW